MLINITLPLVGTITMPATAAALIAGWVIGMVFLVVGFIDARPEKAGN
jgi:hypothetical protein